jgi:hypothetical protein
MLAKEIKFIERFKARASHAAQVQSRQRSAEWMDVIPAKRSCSCRTRDAGQLIEQMSSPKRTCRHP